MDLYKHFQSRLRSLNSLDLHKKLLTHIIRSNSQPKYKTDFDIIRENHKFLWEDEDEPSSWEEELAKKYYDKLFKEYCIADLTYYKDGQIALRWQTENELISGKGQFMCGDKHCEEIESLKTWEVNFAYIEHGERKNALVKLRLCTDCSYKLNYKHKRKEVKRSKKRKRSKENNDKQEDEPSTTKKEKSKADEENSNETGTATADKQDESAKQEDNIWKTANQVVEQERSRDADFEEFLDQLLL